MEEKRLADRRYINKMEIKVRDVMCDHLYWLEPVRGEHSGERRERCCQLYILRIYIYLKQYV